ncbi:TRAP transporter small permease [Undibacter mobilis]|nr:TRAP transporter small permease [Undibacter mobilis]
MVSQYSRLMDIVHRGCLIVAGGCLLIITLIIPYGVFTRYVLNSAASWPEPLATLLMIVMSFISAVVCYREYLHIGVGVLPAFLNEPYKTALGWLLEALMLLTNLFMLWWGLKLVATTYNQIIPEFPVLSVGISYLPVPLGGGLTILFIIERMMKGQFFQEADAETVSTLTTE